MDLHLSLPPVSSCWSAQLLRYEEIENITCLSAPVSGSRRPTKSYLAGDSNSNKGESFEVVPTHPHMIFNDSELMQIPYCKCTVFFV